MTGGGGKKQNKKQRNFHPGSRVFWQMQVESVKINLSLQNAQSYSRGVRR